MTKSFYQKSFLFLLTFILTLTMTAQDDVILKSDGDEMHGKITLTYLAKRTPIYKR